MINSVILAGGFGSRISEETLNKPKPLISIGQKPIIWFIMRVMIAQKMPLYERNN